MAITKKLLAKATKAASKPISNKKSSQSKKLKDESSSESESEGITEFAEISDLSGSDLDPIDSQDEDDSDSDSEEDDVTEEALERMMKLLGDVDPDELMALEAEMLNAQGSESGSEGEEGSEGEDDDEDLESEGGLYVEGGENEVYIDLDAESSVEGDNDEEEEEEAGLFEDLEEEDGDVVPVERTTVNDKEALMRVLASFKTETTFFDTLTLTYPTPLNIPDAENDLERELEFYKQSLWAVQHATTLYESASLPFTRPSDYFAEMLKTDAHMSLIRQSLLNESAGIKASEDARKLRDQKKFGKKVQVERLKEREKEKKDVGKRLEGLKKKRKAEDGGGFSTTEDFDIALEDAIAGPSKRVKMNESERGGRGGRGGRGDGRGISRRGRDSKFGNPTASRRPKENNDKIDGDGSGGRGGSRGRGGRGGRGGSRGGGRGGGGGDRGRGASKQRLGKSRRN